MISPRNQSLERIERGAIPAKKMGGDFNAAKGTRIK